MIMQKNCNLLAKTDKIDAKIFAEFPCVGPKTSYAMLAIMSELGTFTSMQVGSIKGVTTRVTSAAVRSKPEPPFPWRRSRVLRTNSILTAFYNRLTANGRPHKVTLTAFAQKLLTTINTAVRNNTPGDPPPSPIKALSINSSFIKRHFSSREVGKSVVGLSVFSQRGESL